MQHTQWDTQIGLKNYIQKFGITWNWRQKEEYIQKVEDNFMVFAEEEASEGATWDATHEWLRFYDKFQIKRINFEGNSNTLST